MEGLLKNQGLNPLVHMGIWGIWNSFWVFKNQEDETKNPEGMNIYKQKQKKHQTSTYSLHIQHCIIFYHLWSHVFFFNPHFWLGPNDDQRSQVQSPTLRPPVGDLANESSAFYVFFSCIFNGKTHCLKTSYVQCIFM